MCKKCENSKNEEAKEETKVCKICGKEKPISEMLVLKGKPRPRCKVCLYFSRHKDIIMAKNWSIEEYRTIVDNILNDKCDYINDIIPYLNNKSLDELVDLLKNNLKIGNFKHSIKILKQCPNCKEDFYVTVSTYNTICCGKKCSDELKTINIETNCDNCGKIIFKKPYHLKNRSHSFCNKKCSDKYRSKNSIEVRCCEYCGEEFECSESCSQRFCSTKCADKGKSHSIYAPRVTTNCDWCKKEIDVRKTLHDKWDHHFCNKECFNNWFKNVYSQTEMFKNKSRKIALNNLQSGVFNKTDTAIQRKINDLLDKMNINYENEKIFDYYSLDNYLYDYNLIIEVNGDYFHTNPLKYKNIKYENQLNKIYSDKAKDTFLKTQYNINVLYLWEYDINNHIDKCEELIYLYIRNKGILRNYNSFNYILKDNKLKINKDIIKPYIYWNKENLEAIIDLKIIQERQERMRNPDLWMTFNCEVCGEEVSILKSKYEKSKNHFCSTECASIFTRTRIEVKCSCCGENFEIIKSRYENSKNNIFCSRECYYKYLKENPKNPFISTCNYCGKEYTMKEYDYNKSIKHYCSIECMGKDRITQIKCNCDNCNKEIIRTNSEFNSYNNHFCSKKCEGEFKSKRKDPKNWIIFNCEQCGKEVTEKRSSYKKKKHHFCSNKCSGEFRNKSVSFKCDNCGNDKTLKLSKYNLSKNHFCCYECSVEYKKKRKTN